MLARRLRLLRLLSGWSQEDLAAASGLHRTYISLLERAACNITLDNLEKLAQALGVGLSELFEREPGWPPARGRRRRRSGEALEAAAPVTKSGRAAAAAAAAPAPLDRSPRSPQRRRKPEPC